GPLEGTGRYEARIACSLWSKDGTCRYDIGIPGRIKIRKKHPYFTQHGKDKESDGDQYIANMRDGAVAGFKYFRLGEASKLVVEIGGRGKGVLRVFTDAAMREEAAAIRVSAGARPGAGIFSAGGRAGRRSLSRAPVRKFAGSFHAEEGVKPLFFRFEGTGSIDFLAFTLLNKPAL
ncbi:MAG: hypothetical protein K6C06_00570, partial [Lachnospiraceae bacterium]|nr:hypothetical protein [Lachnospiraceae bacterium]